jgi:hypothetical protein
MSKDNIKIIQIDTDPAVKSIKDLRKELREYKDQMANLEEGSDAFLEIANKAGEVKHKIDEISESVKGASADFGDMVGNVTNVAAGLTGAFQAVAGGLQAMGLESKAIDETIKRMQGLMAVTQGLSAIDDGIKSFGKLTKAIQGSAGAMKVFKAISNPIALAAVAAVVVAIGAAWNKWGEDLRKSIPALDKFIKKWDGTAAEEAERIAEAQRKFNEELAVSNQEVAEILQNRKWNAITKEAQDRIKFLEEEIKIYDNKVKNIVKQQETATEAEWNRLNEIGLGYLEQIRLWKHEIDDLYNNPKYQLSNQKPKKTTPTNTTPTVEKTKEEILAEMGLVEFTDQDLAEGLERVKQYWEGVYDIRLEQNKRSEKTDAEKLNEEISIEKQRLTLYEEGTLEYEKQLTKIWELEQKISTATEESVVVLTNKFESMTNAGNMFFDGLKETMSSFTDSSLGLSSQWIGALDQFQLAFQQTMKIVESEGKAGWTAYGQVAATSLGGIGTLLNALSQEQDVSNEKGFEQQKKLQIAATTMNMLSGIMAAWTSSMALPAPTSFIVGAVQTAATAALGAAQIAKIKSQTMNSAMASGAINPTSVNNMIVPPVQYSAAVQGAQTEGAIKDTKVYVTETDIASTMQKVSVQESENTY